MKISKDKVKAALLDALTDGETVNLVERVGDYCVFDLVKELEQKGYVFQYIFGTLIPKIKFTECQKKCGYKPLNQNAAQSQT